MKKTVSFLGLFLLLLPILQAHSAYVLENPGDYLGPDPGFLLSALQQPAFWIGTGMVLLVAFLLHTYALRSKRLVRFLNHCIRRLERYESLVPWMLRLSLGIALMGGGVGRFLLSPTLPLPGYALLQTALGFVFLLGFLNRFAALLTLGLFFQGLRLYPALYGNLEIVGACLALILIGSGKPGLDDILQLGWFRHYAQWLEDHKKYAGLVLRAFLAITFIYLAFYEKLLNPHLTEAVVQQYQLTRFVPVSATVWVLGAGLVELTLGLLLLLGLYTRTVTMISFVFLGVTLFYFGESVTSHVTLFGILSVINVLGGGRYSLDHYFGKKHFVL